MSKIIESYVENVEKLRQSRENAVTEDDLRDLAQDLGLSDEDLKAVEKAVQDHVERGQGYINHQMWSDAINELTDAANMAPHRAQVLYALANAHFCRAEVDGTLEDVEQADHFARRCLDVDPNFPPAFALLGELRELSEKLNKSTPHRGSASQPVNLTRSGQRTNLKLAVLVFLLLIAGAGAAFLVMVQSSDDTMESAQIAVESHSPDILEIINDVVPETKPPEIKTPQQPGQLPFSFEPGEWKGVVEVKMTDIQNKVYPDSAFFAAKGLITSTGAVEVKEVVARLELRNDAGEVLVADAWRLHDDHDPAMRPGDVDDFNTTKKSKPEVTNAVLRLTTVKTQPASKSYKAAKPLKTLWEIKAPEGFKLDIRERTTSFSENSIVEGGYFRATWELKNTGTRPMKLLKLHLKGLDKAGKQLEERAWLVAYSSSPPIEVGETRVEDTILKMPTSYDRYELSVIEIE